MRLLSTNKLTILRGSAIVVYYRVESREYK